MTSLDHLRSGQLAGSRRLDLSEGLKEFPREIFDLADTLEVLNLSGNQLDALPADLHRLHKLRVIFCSDNRFTRLPECLGDCPSLTMVGFKANQIDSVSAAALPPGLRWLILTDNRVATLPSALGERPALEKLMLAGNRLTKLPESLQQSRQLALLRLSANAFEALPPWLLDLPRLAWLAFAGNPFSQAQEFMSQRMAQVHRVDWSEITLLERLGEGASGVIHRALRTTGHGVPPAPVAVKLFKGTITSDGLPGSEMAAWLAAGQHPGLIPVSGTVAGHPQGTPGIVMPLIEPSFMTLAGPPSLETCSRDVYPEGQRFDAANAFRLARCLADATAHLHARGILHGDLYAHNTLWREDGTALLGDFGAASFLPEADAAMSRGLQRLEVRAFGCLLEELMGRCQAAAPHKDALEQGLATLRDACLDCTPARRPLFQEISAFLTAL